jgi:formylglycine-generating enzyme required for sulfatase activity
MGDADSEFPCNGGEYPVTLTEDFYLGRTEVTNQEYLEMLQWAYEHHLVLVVGSSVWDNVGPGVELLDMSEEGCEIGFDDGVFVLQDAGKGLLPDHPVKTVTWFGAAAFCNWLSLKEGLAPAYDHDTWECNAGDPYRAEGYRLPTEAEWEYAAQYDDGRICPWGNDAPDCGRTNYWAWIRGRGCRDWTARVASLRPEKKIGGAPLYDMAGNVWEWCNDWERCPADPSPADPPGPATGTKRIFRGGSWLRDAKYLRCAARAGSAPPSGRQKDLGFRVARTVDP